MISFYIGYWCTFLLVGGYVNLAIWLICQMYKVYGEELIWLKPSMCSNLLVQFVRYAQFHNFRFGQVAVVVEKSCPQTIKHSSTPINIFDTGVGTASV